MNIPDCKDEDLTNQQSKESLDIKNEPIFVHYREPSNEIKFRERSIDSLLSDRSKDLRYKNNLEMDVSQLSFLKTFIGNKTTYDNVKNTCRYKPKVNASVSKVMDQININKRY